MKVSFYACWKNEVSRQDPVERRFHSKSGASAQQPKAERAFHSAVVRPQAAEKSRSASRTSICGFACRGVGGSVVAAPRSNAKRVSSERAERFTFDRFAIRHFERKDCWFEPTRRRKFACFLVRRRKFACFLVQDRLRASDVLHRDWDWSGWL